MTKLLRATDESRNPQAIEVPVPGGRPKLALAFTTAAIWTVIERRETLWWIGGIAVFCHLVRVFLRGMPGLVLIVIAGLLMLAWFVLATLYQRKMNALRKLATSGASPTVVAAELRRIAGWPEAKGDPLADWPARRP